MEVVSRRVTVDAPFESVAAVLDNPAIAIDSVPPEFAHWKSPDGRHVTVVFPRGLFGKLKAEFAVSSQVKGNGDVVYELHSEYATIEIRVTAKPSGKATDLEMEARLVGEDLPKSRKFLEKYLERIAATVEARALQWTATPKAEETGQPSPATPKAAPATWQSSAGPQAAGGARAVQRLQLPQTAKLDDMFFEADVLIRGKPLYADVIAFTSLAEVVEPFIDESMKAQVYVKLEFPDGYTLKLLMERGRIVGALGVKGDSKLSDYDAVLEAERHSPSTATLTVYAI